MSTIWIIREPRSGSTWLTHHVAKQLGLLHFFIDRTVVGSSPAESELEFDIEVLSKEVSKFPKDSTIFSTHFFTMLHIMDRFEDPIIIRCTRRNKLEQFLSDYLAKTTNYSFTNITTDEQQQTTREIFEQLIETRLLVPKKDLVEYLRIKKRNEVLWDTYATKFKNFTVYYEDLCENGVDIAPINLYNCRIEESGHTEKLPEYKTKVFLNYDMIQNWIKDY